MFKGWLIFLYLLGYLGILFVVAYIAEHMEKKGKSIVSNPYVYSLSLAVYCTSWTFYGSVGKAATSGLSFLTIYLGPTLMACLWWIILRKMIRIAKENRITTISDFIGSRYGNSIFLSALVAFVAFVGIIPYLGLQIKAIISTFTIFAGETRGSAEAGWAITLILGIFAIMFGARKLDASERHEGIIFAIAFESIVKLVAFLAVGYFVTYTLFDGFTDIFTKIRETDFGHLLYLGQGTQISFTEWASLLFLSMMAIMFLPRQFHVSVVENSDVSHVSKAMWLFPLYLFLINIFVMPVAFGGLLLGGSNAGADNFVLTIPLGQKKYFLAIFVFIGGFSAATGMIIIESLALSTMVMNNLVMPAIFRFNRMKGFSTFILVLKRTIIMCCVFLGYFFAVSIGEFYSLVDIGLKSFEAVTIFAPAIIIGLYWKRGNKAGAIGGILAGFIIWVYTLLVPALIRAGMVDDSGIIGGIMHSEFLNPRSLFGLRGLDKWSHSLFWGLAANLIFYFGLSIFTRQGHEEERQALAFVDYYSPQLLLPTRSFSLQQVQDILGQYIGRGEAQDIVDSFLSRNKLDRARVSEKDITRLKDEAERVLSGALGSSIASIIFESKVTLTERERGELSNSIKQMTDTLRLSRQELESANRNLSYLKEFSENIIESAPVGIVTVDAALNIRYWNRQMENITGKKRSAVNNRFISDLLPWIPAEKLGQSIQEEMTIHTGAQQTFKVNISPFKDPAGGFVVIIEDITEKKVMEEQLLQASKLASIGKLTAGISHEIGNPLASISSLVQELRAIRLESPEDRTFTGESLKVMNSHLERIAKIVRSLGDFARISSGEKMLSSIRDIIERTINLVRLDKKFKNVDISLDLADLPKVRVNPNQMQQVFLNLLLNSFDAMPDGGKITINGWRSDDLVEVVFRDTGIGMDKPTMERIFDPFFTTKPLGKGTGLGLSICYGIIREHNGTITVQSAKGKGTTFTLKLRADEDE